MKTIEFLDLEAIQAIHLHQVKKYGGDIGVRDSGLLESAIAMPESTFGGEYLHPSIPAMAAAYLFHLVKNHPFVDGNKRTGIAAALAFLKTNGYVLKASQSELIAFVTDVAASNIDKGQTTDFFKAKVHAK